MVLSLTTLTDCLFSILDTSPNVTIACTAPLPLPPKFLCKLLAIMNYKHSLTELYALTYGHILPSYFSLRQLSSLSRELRKDPAIVNLNLRRSKSLCDLATLRLKTNDTGWRKKLSKDVLKHQSCPDLLEMQSLHNMHPNLHEALETKKYYYSTNNPVMELLRILISH